MTAVFFNLALSVVSDYCRIPNDLTDKTTYQRFLATYLKTLSYIYTTKFTP